MYYSSQYNDGAPGLLGDPMAMHRGDDFGYNQTADFGRGDIQFSGGGGGGNPYNNYDNFDDRVGYTDSMSSGGYSQQERNFDNMSFGLNMGGPSLQPQQSDLQDNMNYYRQNSLPDVGMDYNQPPFEQRNFSFASEENNLHDASFESRRDSFKDMDRERDRERNRRSQGRDRPRNNRRDDNWDRGSRRDRGDRDWTNGDRDRRREKRNSRERSMRDRSPRDDGSMELSNDSSRMDLSEEDMHGSPGRDRHRDWDRSRQDMDHERDRERDRDRHRERDRDRERSRSRDDRERDRDRDRGDREGERWMTEEPSATILLRGLNNNIVENDVIQELIRIGMPPKDVRFMRRVTGASRGFGFVEFQSQSEAQRWMDLNQGQLQLPGMGQRISMHYSAPRVSRDSRDQANRMDWMCKCGAHNFKRRDFCYKCNTNRRLAEDPLCGVTELDPATHVGKNPCNTLLFRDLDALTTEQGVLQAIAALTSMAIKNTQVIRDDMNTSLCFAFLELNSVASAKQLHDFLQAQNPPLAIDGKQVMVSYAKNTFNTSLDIISKAQQKLQQNQYYLNYSNYYAQGQGADANSQYYNYSQYYGTDAAATTASTEPTPPANSTNAAAAVAQTAIMQAQAAKTLATSSTAVSTAAPEATSTSQYPVYPPPDVTKYQYDKTSGYYYDPTTGLYYEPNTQYYYNAKTTQWMYWDAEKSTYLPAPTQGTESSQSTETDTTSHAQTEKTEKEEKKEKEKTKVAKKIAKDMEKWAKAMNAQKDAIKEEQRKNTMAAGRKESAAADAGFAILQKSKEDMKLMPPPPLSVNPAPDIAIPSASAPGGSKAGLVASYGGDSDDSADEDDVGAVDESKLVDWSKLACLLCKRQFQSREILTKHTQFSDLHKQNLEKLKAKSSAGKVEKKEYRDRAKERRQKYGTPAPPEPRKQAVVELPEVYEQPTKAGIGADNIGNKMLQKMGWSAGLGLGKSNQGLTAPIETQRRAATAGLGARGANIVAEEGASYKDNVKKTLFARYNEAD